MSDERTTDPRHTEALERFALGLEATKDQRDRELADLAFQVPEKQWPSGVLDSRKAQIIAGVPVAERPVISIPMLDQPVQLVLNQEKAAHLGVQVHPLSEDADDDTAGVQQGLYRAIERNSRAHMARSWSFDRAVKCGWGVYRVLTQPCRYTGDPAAAKDQDIIIKRILHQQAVVLDPFAQEPDWSDGEWAFVTEWVPKARFKREFGASKLATADDDALKGILADRPEWVKSDDGAAQAFLVAEYFYLDRSKDADQPTVKWCKMDATGWLDEEDWPGHYIPIIPVIGNELQPFDGERRWAGLYTNAKDSVRLVNYAASAAIEMAALETKAPYMMAEGQEEGHEKEFELANVRNFPYLRYKPVNLGGTYAPPPQRTQVDMSRLGPSMALLEMGRDFVQHSTGAFDPSLGQDRSKSESGKKVLALQQQHDQGNSHYLDNLAQVSMTYEAKVVLDLIPKIYDRAGRIAQIIDGEDNKKTVMLNAPFRMDGKKPVAASTTQQAAPYGSMLGLAGQSGTAGDVKHYDLTAGIYGVSVTIGKSYNTRVEHGNDQLGQLLQAEPALFQILGDIWLKFQDWPGHTEAAERVKKMLPPPLQDQQGQDAAGELQQAKAQMQQMQQALQEMQKAIETDKVKVDGDIEKARINADAAAQLERMKQAFAVDIQKLKNDNAVQIELIRTKGKGALQDDAQAHEQGIETAYAAHEQFMAEQNHERALEMGETQLQGQMAQGEQQHGHALEQGDVSHQQTLETQEQAAELAPQPEAE